MRLMNLERSFDDDDEHFEDSQDFDTQKSNDVCTITPPSVTNGFIPHQSLSHINAPSFSVPPPMATIPECDDCDEC